MTMGRICLAVAGGLRRPSPLVRFLDLRVNTASFVLGWKVCTTLHEFVRDPGFFYRLCNAPPSLRGASSRSGNPSCFHPNHCTRCVLGRGFLSSRRQLGELPMPSILSMPASAASTKAFGSLGLPNLIKQSGDGESRKLVRRVEDFKGLSVHGITRLSSLLGMVRRHCRASHPEALHERSAE